MSIEFKPIDVDFYVFVNKAELVDRAVELGFTNVILVEKELLTDEELRQLKETGKGVVQMQFCTRDNSESIEKLWDQIRDAEIPMVSYTNSSYISELNSDWNDVDSLNKYIEWFPTVEEIEIIADHDGMIWYTDYVNKCGNCHSDLRPDDKYCTCCGTKRGDGTFKPYHNKVVFLYGCPLATKYRCKNCGHVWFKTSFAPESGTFCPMCGKSRQEELKSYDYLTSDIEELKKELNKD